MLTISCSFSILACVTAALCSANSLAVLAFIGHGKGRKKLQAEVLMTQQRTSPKGANTERSRSLFIVDGRLDTYSLASSGTSGRGPALGGGASRGRIRNVVSQRQWEC